MCHKWGHWSSSQTSGRQLSWQLVIKTQRQLLFGRHMFPKGCVTRGTVFKGLRLSVLPVQRWSDFRHWAPKSFWELTSTSLPERPGFPALQLGGAAGSEKGRTCNAVTQLWHHRTRTPPEAGSAWRHCPCFFLFICSVQSTDCSKQTQVLSDFSLLNLKNSPLPGCYSDGQANTRRPAEALSSAVTQILLRWDEMRLWVWSTGRTLGTQ